MDRPDVLVVGGGIIGTACARSLARKGLGVRALDGTPRPGVATEAAAGMLAPLLDAHEDDPTVSLRVLARDLYIELAAELLERTGIDVGLWIEGIVQLAFTEEDATELKGQIAWQRQQGYKSDWLPPEDLLELCPGVSPDTHGALIAPEGGALEPVALHRALRADAEMAGATIERNRSVTAVRVDGDRAMGVEIGSDFIEAGAVVIAAGCWSGQIGGLPRPLSVEPIRGQMAATSWPEGEPPRIVIGGPGYVMHRNGEAWCGTTMEHAGFDASTSEAGLAQVYNAMRLIYPTLATAPVQRTWAGLRPLSPDGLPLIGADPDITGLWYATGHGRNGILLAAVTGEIIARRIVDETIEHDLRALDPGRFWRI